MIRPTHPVWRPLNLAILCLFVFGLSWLIANEFDDEIWLTVGVAGLGSVGMFIERLLKPDPERVTLTELEEILLANGTLTIDQITDIQRTVRRVKRRQ